MSADYVEEPPKMMCCASCGIAEVDDIKLKECAACDLVRYCSDTCQQEHRPKHESICKERAAELRDDILFRQPEGTHFGDCPICFLPIPIDHNKSGVMGCCSKLICCGCNRANERRELEESLDPTCPFCRHPMPANQAECDIVEMKRVEANDPVAIQRMGEKLYEEGDYEDAFEYWTKAAGLGDAAAHFNLSVMYHNGQGVEKDEEKGLPHLEEAAIAGHPDARFHLACYEARNGRFDRATKHWIIAANHGYENAIQALKRCYGWGKVSKDDFAAALRAHHAAVEATKSSQREAADKALAVAKARVE